jgi:hypothetical protein
LKKAKIAMVQAPDEVVGAANLTIGELNRAGSLPYEQLLALREPTYPRGMESGSLDME